MLNKAPTKQSFNYFKICKKIKYYLLEVICNKSHCIYSKMKINSYINFSIIKNVYYKLLLNHIQAFNNFVI